ELRIVDRDDTLGLRDARLRTVKLAMVCPGHRGVDPHRQVGDAVWENEPVRRQCAHATDACSRCVSRSARPCAPDGRLRAHNAPTAATRMTTMASAIVGRMASTKACVNTAWATCWICWATCGGMPAGNVRLVPLCPRPTSRPAFAALLKPSTKGACAWAGNWVAKVTARLCRSVASWFCKRAPMAALPS